MFVFFLAFSVYANTIFNNYNLDDELVTRNHVLTSAGLNCSNIKQIFTEPYYKDKTGYSYGYRPLTLLSFTIEHSIFGDKPGVSHFINVLLYCLLSVLVLKLLETVLRDYSQALVLAATIIFVLHPLHTEVVGGIKNRDQILSFLFGLISFLLLFSISGAFYNRSILAFICFIAGLMSKPDIIMLIPLSAIALLYFRKERVIRVVFISFLFSIAAIYFVENISNEIKLFCLLAIVGFTLFVAIVCRFLSDYKGAKGKCIEAYDFVCRQIVYLRFANRRGVKALVFSLFLIVNIGLGMFFFEAADMFSAAIILLPLLIIYGFELSFFSINRIWPFILFMDIVSIFLLAKNDHQDVTDALVTLMGTLHLSLFLDAQKRKFLIFFAGLVVAFIVYRIYIARFTDAIPAVVLWAGLSYWYRKKGYQAVWGKRSILGLIIISALGVLKEYTSTSTSDHITDLPLEALLFLLMCSIAAGVYFNGSAKRLTGLLGGLQVLFIVLLFSIYPHNFGSGLLAKICSRQTTNYIMGKVNPFSHLPRPYNAVKFNHPISIIEFPVKQNDPVSVKAATSAYQYARYMLLLVKPWPMSFYYGYKEVVPHYLNEPVVIISTIFFAAMLGAAFATAGRQKLLSFALFFIILSVIPYLVLVVSIPGLLGDRYTFQASLGFSLVLAYALFYFSDGSQLSPLAGLVPKRKSAKLLVWSIALISLLYAGLTLTRNYECKDAVSMMRQDILHLNKSAQANNLLAIELEKEAATKTQNNGQKELRKEALLHFKKVLEIYPHLSVVNRTAILELPYQRDLYINLAGVYAGLKENDSAYLYLHGAALIDSANGDIRSLQDQISVWK